ncbi:Lanosterol 14-alpha-demethylase [Batrachochytrium dendrobatidis]|nr:Lanosterol 14-alpha-demethylase [Batrachochytrium dendrobatidis]KAK5669358.1 Lanosterol 14-alpha-demethylase [Batrachochytrium dendrobatidis]
MGLFFEAYESVRNVSGLPPDQFHTVVAITSLVFVLTVWLLSYALNQPLKSKDTGSEPPRVPVSIPFIGAAIAYGVDPIKFLIECRQKYGDCFTFVMLGRKMTFCLGPDGNHYVFNVPVADATAEGAYKKLTVPVFGAGVVYDVHNAMFMEQKKFVKDAFNSNSFNAYMLNIWNETNAFFNDWEDHYDANMIFDEMSELTIRTASHCLLGKEIRQQLHSTVAQLYHDLDSGLAPINVFFRWLPLPVYFKRDRANKIMSKTFVDIIKKRRATNSTDNADLMQTLMFARYRDGTSMTDDEIAHLLIATLMGGQHTSSTTLCWMLFELARRQDVVDKLLHEQSMVLTGKPDTPPEDLPEFTHEQIRQLTFLDCVMKETLRLHPPIHTVMRKVEKSMTYRGMTIPAGHFICGSAAVSHLDPTRFPDPLKFEPSRFLNNDEGSGEWSINTIDIAQKSARSHFLPFGAGRHRCIGEAFAYIQNKTILSAFIRRYTHKLYVDPNTGKEHFPSSDYTSLITIPEKPARLSITRRSVKA